MENSNVKTSHWYYNGEIPCDGYYIGFGYYGEYELDFYTVNELKEIIKNNIDPHIGPLFGPILIDKPEHVEKK